ncbi:MAG: hypothetical protein ACI9XJ_002120 [Marivirga sp.]|jgi:hypothetical protein
MKSILISLISLVAYSSYSQTWTTVDIDHNLSISLPSHFDSTDTTDNIIYGASTSLCNLTVDRAMLHETLSSNNIPIDYLEYYSYRFKAGLGFSGSLEIHDTSDGAIENVKTRTLKMNRNRKVKHGYL